MLEYLKEIFCTESPVFIKAGLWILAFVFIVSVTDHFLGIQNDMNVIDLVIGVLAGIWIQKAEHINKR